MINSDRMANLVLMSDAGYEQNCCLRSSMIGSRKVITTTKDFNGLFETPYIQTHRGPKMLDMGPVRLALTLHLLLLGVCIS